MNQSFQTPSMGVWNGEWWDIEPVYLKLRRKENQSGDSGFMIGGIFLGLISEPSLFERPQARPFMSISRQVE